MTYREEMKELRIQAAEHRKKVFAVIIVTVAIFTVVFLTATIALGVDLATDSSFGNGASGGVSGGGGGGGGGDKKAPVVTLKQGDTIYLFAGENTSWRDLVTVTDSSNTGKITDMQPSSDFNRDVPGTYSITYTAADAAGNKKSYTFAVVVTQKQFSHAALMDEIKAIVESGSFGATLKSSKKQQVQAIYNYVNNRNNVTFVNTSNTPNINRNNWKTGWVEEAHRTLDESKGDCYSYYSLSVAFFTYFDIEYEGIQRDNSNIPSSEGTHFWLMVNIGTSQDQWYYFDATRLGGTFEFDGSKNGCLMTLEKIQSYKPSSPLGYDFYEFDPSKYHKASTTVIN